MKYNIVYINVIANLSVDCNCCWVVENPCIKDIGLLVSLEFDCFIPNIYRLNI